MCWRWTTARRHRSSLEDAPNRFGGTDLTIIYPNVGPEGREYTGEPPGQPGQTFAHQMHRTGRIVTVGRHGGRVFRPLRTR